MRFSILPSVIVLFCVWAFAPGSLQVASAVDYLSEIKPLLAEKCYACHGALAQESSLRLETRELMLRGGDSGAVIAPGKADESLLIERITADVSDRMPPADQGSAMTADQIALIRRWIDEGAEAPDEVIPPAPAEHWAFQPVRRPAIANTDRYAHPLDALLDARRRELGLRVQPLATRSLQIRRLYLDLIGLPPTNEQLQDTRPWHEIVDELLTSPQHGERWGRHWMDVWRYCDWYGLGEQLRNSQKHLWHWRDWIVDSLNADKGYDRMILEMIAGDELEPSNPDVVAATGFLARNYYLFNRTTWLDDTIEHTGKAFLGLTLNCAKCHDHKYDPISQQDYYRMRAIFEPHQVRLDPIPGVTDFDQDGLPRVFDDQIDAVTYLHVRGDPNNPDTDQSIEPGVPQILSRFASPIQPVDLPAEAFAPGIRSYVASDRLQQFVAEIAKAEKTLAEARQRHQQPSSEHQTSEQATPFEFADDFDQFDSEAWSVIGDGWQYRDGSVHQTVSTRDTQMLRLNHQLPRDFEVLCQYTTTGGTTYKSVTFRFDQSDDGQHNNFVYTSAHEPGPKVQAAYTRNGQTTYPPSAQRGQQIEIGRAYRLRFAVRDTLVNVWLDDAFLFAYRFPSRQQGFFSLSGFDATVAFDSIQIRSLSPDVELKSAGGADPVDSEVAVSLAEAKLKLARARRAAFEAAWKADRAKWLDKASEDIMKSLAREAARFQFEADRAAAEVETIEKAGDDSAKAAAVKRIESAQAKLAALETEPPKYESIRGAKKALESPAHQETDYAPTYSPQSTGRRLALARWITSTDHPLTARVAVNHVWMRHFGSPLVESVFDFGLRAKQPLQWEVLDFLAYEFMASGWSFRHLHRLIVTSEAYRLDSSTLNADESTLASDPDNQYYWRMNARRMESQVVRDTVLSLAGKIDLTLGGPSIEPNQGSARRSLYFKHSRDEQDKFLEMFDDADELQCYRRSESIVPQQALALSNSKLAIEMSGHIARRLSASEDPADRDAFVNAVFRSLLGRDPTAAELEPCRDFFEQLSTLHQSNVSEIRLRERFVQAVLNHNDFVTIR